MIGQLTAFIFLSTMSQSADVPRAMPVIVSQPVDTVTLTCPVTSEFYIFKWYKQPLGKTMQTVAEISFDKNNVSKQFRDQRFNITKKDGQHIFIIRNITKEDEATYYCQKISQYGLNNINSTFLVVNDESNPQNCVSVRQNPPSASVQPGGSVTLQCSLLSKNNNVDKEQCPHQQNVHWFRAGSVEAHTGTIYKSKNNSCVYSLSKTIRGSSDDGTYYCAVETCGQILFGEGTRVETRQDLVTVALGVLLACCVVVSVLCVCLKRGRVCEHCKDAPVSTNCPQYDMSATSQSETLAGGVADVNYAALNFSSRKVEQGSKTRLEQDSLYSTCVYFAVRADSHTQQNSF